MSPLLKMIDELKTHPLISIKELEVGEPATDIHFEMIETGFDIKIPDELKELLCYHDGLKLIWVADEDYPWKRLYEGDNFTPYGRFWLPNLDCMFMGPNGSDWETYIWSEETEELKKLVPIDYFDNNRSECVCMTKMNGTLKTDKLYYSSIDVTSKFPLECSLKEYLDLSVNFYCFSYWQQALMEPESGTRKYLDNYFPQLFPDKTIKYHKF